LARLLQPALLVLLAVALLAPIWAFPHLSLVDYSDHLARAFVLAHLEDPGLRLGEFYAADWGSYPYLFSDVVLVALQKIVPAETAGRLLLSLAVLSLPPAVWFFLRQANRDESTTLAWWALLFSWNLFLLCGLLNMHFSLVFCFLAVGLWLRYLERPGAMSWIALLVVVTLLYFTHLMGYAIAALVMTAYLLLERRGLRTLLETWAAFLPGAAAFAHAGMQGNLILGTSTFTLSGKFISPLVALKTHFPWLDWSTTLGILACFVAALWRNPELRWNRTWLRVVLLLYVVYWLMPGPNVAMSRAGDSLAGIRILPVMLLLSLAAVHVGTRARRFVIVALVLFALRTAGLISYFVQAQPELEAMTAAIQATPPRVRVLPLVGWKQDSLERWTYAHFWANGVIRKGWRTPYLFHERGVHPLRFVQQGYAPQPILPTVYRGSLDWERIRHDYDYTWAYNVPGLHEELSKIGAVVFSDGNLRVFRLNSPGPLSFAAPVRATMQRSAEIHSYE
jgi:hypothetical protein